MDLSKLSVDELIESYSQIVLLLKEKKVIRTKNLLGDLAEYLVVNYYKNTSNLPNLQVAPAGTQNVDALSRQGERYSIKATTGTVTGAFYGLIPPNTEGVEVQKFEYVVIACFNDNYKLTKILELTWEQFIKHKKWHKTVKAYNLSVTRNLIAQSRVIFEEK